MNDELRDLVKINLKSKPCANCGIKLGSEEGPIHQDCVLVILQELAYYKGTVQNLTEMLHIEINKKMDEKEKS